MMFHSVALYNKDKVQLSNVIGVNYSKVPVNEQFNSLNYSSDLFDGSKSVSQHVGKQYDFHIYRRLFFRPASEFIPVYIWNVQIRE